MKRVRCPKCDNFITFDETKYKSGQRLVFQCPQCGKEFGIRIGVSKLRKTQKEENNQPTDDEQQSEYGSLHVIPLSTSNPFTDGRKRYWTIYEG